MSSSRSISATKSARSRVVNSCNRRLRKSPSYTTNRYFPVSRSPSGYQPMSKRRLARWWVIWSISSLNNHERSSAETISGRGSISKRPLLYAISQPDGIRKGWRETSTAAPPRPLVKSDRCFGEPTHEACREALSWLRSLTMSGRGKTVKRFHEPGDCHELAFSCFRRMPLLTNDDWRSLLSRIDLGLCSLGPQSPPGESMTLVEYDQWHPEMSTSKTQRGPFLG